jgi:hypothetical protein
MPVDPSSPPNTAIAAGSRLAPVSRRGLFDAERSRNPSREDRARRLGRLRAMLRLERVRGVAGHWSYDLARHRALHAAYRRERDGLEAMSSETQSDPAAMQAAGRAMARTP